MKKQFAYILKRNFSRKSHIEQIKEWDNSFIDKVRAGKDISTKDFVNFSRVIVQRKMKDQQTWETFNKNLPNHIQSLDEFGIRRICSALEFNNDHDENIIKQLNLRVKALRKEKGIDENEYQSTKPDRSKYWESLPASVKFWMRYAVIRDWVFKTFSFGILK